MSEWKEIRIGDIASFNDEQFSTKDYWEEKLYLDTGSITRNIIESLQLIPEACDLPSRAKRKVKDKDIIYSTVRPNQKHYGFLKNPPSNLLVSTGFAVIRCNQDKADSEYLYYYLGQDCITDYLQAIGEQAVSAYPSIKAEDIANLEMLLPCLPTQRRIAAILSSLDAKIENNNKVNAKLEEIAQNLFKEWFVDFGPFKDGKFVDSELGPIPEGWRVGTLGDYCKVKSGFAFKSSWWTEAGCPIIKIKNITENGCLNMEDCSYVEKINTLKAKDFKAKRGDLVIAMTGATIGKFNILPHFEQETYINQRVGKFFLGEKPLEKLPFVYCFLNSDKNREQVFNLGQGSAQPNISGADIESLATVYSTNTIDLFNQKCQPIFDAILTNQEENQRLATLRDTLLPKLMSGEIEV